MQEALTSVGTLRTANFGQFCALRNGDGLQLHHDAQLVAGRTGGIDEVLLERNKLVDHDSLTREKRSALGGDDGIAVLLAI